MLLRRSFRFTRNCVNRRQSLFQKRARARANAYFFFFFISARDCCNNRERESQSESDLRFRYHPERTTRCEIKTTECNQIPMRDVETLHSRAFSDLAIFFAENLKRDRSLFSSPPLRGFRNAREIRTEYGHR